jgi:hypothetical protein
MAGAKINFPDLTPILELRDEEIADIRFTPSIKEYEDLRIYAVEAGATHHGLPATAPQDQFPQIASDLTIKNRHAGRKTLSLNPLLTHG